MTPLLRRIILEKRALGLPLVIALVANVFAYVVVVRPLEVKSAGAADRARQSAVALAAAEKIWPRRERLSAGKSEADQELSAFYQKVLPADLRRPADSRIRACRSSPGRPAFAMRPARPPTRTNRNGTRSSDT